MSDELRRAVSEVLGVLRAPLCPSNFRLAVIVLHRLETLARRRLWEDDQ